MFERLRKRIINLFFTTVGDTKQEATSRDPEQTAIKKVGYAFVKSASGGSARKNFESPEFDLEVIENAYNTESYIRQAIDKYLDLIFKAGWQLKGKNEKSLQYIKTRLAVMEEATDTPLNAFLKEIAENLLKFANTFIIKARIKQPLNIPGLNIQGMGGLEPVGGYFCLAPKTIQIARDANGTVLQYQQKVSGSNKPLLIKPENMVHIAWKKPTGMAFGVPFLLPVLDDIRLLREIEDNVANLLYKYLHPLYKFIVGLQEDGKESTPEEIEYVRQMIQEMPMDGTLVIPERYNVEVVGAEGAAIDASWALEYFRQRVFSGLGIPETVFGIAGTANKSTAENLTVEMHDRIRALQTLIEDEINFRIIKELLMEGGFDPVINPDDMVYFDFQEIAVDEMIKVRNQAIFEYEHNAISFQEMRLKLGMDPEVNESEMFLNRITIPSAQAKASAPDDEPGDPETNNKQKPRNQYGTKTSPKKTASTEDPLFSESFRDLKIKEYFSTLIDSFRSLRNDVISSISSNREDQIELYMSLAKDRILTQASKCIDSAFDLGASDCQRDCKVTRTPEYSGVTKRTISYRAEQNIDRILDDLRKILDTAKTKQDAKEKIHFVSAAFDATEYRIDLMAKYHSRFSYNCGYAFTALGYGREELIANGGKCDICEKHNQDTIKLIKGKSIMNVIPPWHHGCSCHVTIKR
ncbi:MAG TPA: hypothetical protein VIL29_04735 [Pseudothermotoga sp.]